MRDLREIASDALGILGGMQTWFPPRSPGRKAIQEAISKIELAYILGRPHKVRMIINEIAAGNRRFTDILACTGIPRPELEDLLQEMVDNGSVCQTNEKPLSVNGAGRPVRNYEISKNNSR